MTNGGVVNSALSSAGLLTISELYVQTNLGRLEVTRDSASALDQLAVTGNVTLAGTLRINRQAGFTSPSGSTYSVLSWMGLRTGTFATLDGNGLTYTPNYTATALVVTAP